MRKSALLVALSAASLAGGVAFAQSQPYGQTKPEAAKPPMATEAGRDISLTKLDKNGDGFVDKEEAKASTGLSSTFDKADANKDGKLDAAELRAAAQMPKDK